MLDEQQATQIVIDCIRTVSGVPSVDITGTLDDSEISDEARVTNLISEIVNTGVPGYQHRIDEGWFNGTDPDTSVFEVIGIVRDHSIAI